MKLTEDQWKFLQPLLPKEKIRKDQRGRPWRDPRDVLQGILWVLKTGARWKDLPTDRYPSYQTCHRRFQAWVKNGTMKKILTRLAEHLRERGQIDLSETFIDATFVDAKKGVQKSVKPSVVRELKLWQSSTAQVFLSPYALKVLHQLRLRLLKKRFGNGIQKTYLASLSETKLTILICTTSIYDDDLESNLLVPTSAIESDRRLRMDELFTATKDDGKWSDFFHGSRVFDE